MRVGKTDPDATMVRRKDTKLFLGHRVHIGVDGGKARIVTSVVTSSGTVRESQVAPLLLEKHVENTGLCPEEVVGDKVTVLGSSTVICGTSESGLQFQRLTHGRV